MPPDKCSAARTNAIRKGEFVRAAEEREVALIAARAREIDQEMSFNL